MHRAYPGAITTLACFCLVLPGSNAFAQKPGDAILGHWYTEGNEFQVLVYKKATDNGEDRYYGKLVWFKDPVYDADDPEAGKLLRDRENPDKARQNDPLMGMEILKDFRYSAEDAEWVDGTIYDPEVGKVYKCVMRFAEDSTAEGGVRLDVRGYVGIRALGRTTEWYRVPEGEVAKAEGE